MDRISGPNNIVVGGLRQWQDRNNSTNTLGTFGNALWFNGVQESILAAVTALGLAPTDADNTQLYQAIRALAGSTLIGISTAGTTTLTRLHAGIVEVNATSGNVVIDLPAPTGDGVVYRYEFLRIDNTANTVTVTTPSATIIDEPSSSSSITLPGSSFTRLICDSLNYIQDGPYAPAMSLTRVQSFGASGTFNVPSGVTVCEVEVWGGGGGGGGGGANTTVGNGGGGGGGGGYARKIISGLVPSAAVVVTVGAGGASASAYSVSGSNGGTSSFGAYCSATGGSGGTAPSGSTPGLGGGGGTGTGGDYNSNGGTGGVPPALLSTANSTVLQVGGGGAGQSGSGGGVGSPGAGGNGNDDAVASPPGFGLPAATGTNGLVIVRW